MTLLTREQLIALTLIVLGGLAWWYQGRQDPEREPRTTHDGRPEYIVERAEAVAMSERGRPLRILHSPEVRAYPDDGGTELDFPVLWVLDPEVPDGPRWTIRSERAWVDPGGDEILLEGRVHARRDVDGEAPTQVYTSALLLLNEADYAETDRFVEITRGEDWLNAVNGMRLWFREPMRSRFYGRVRQRMAVASAQEEDNNNATRAQ